MTVALASLGMWLMLDRIGLFYATEARVYALVQLLSLLAWCCIGRLWVGKEECDARSRPGVHPAYLWCGLAALLMQLHLTAALAVFWQAVLGTLIASRQASSARRTWGTACVIVALGSAAAAAQSVTVWQHRDRWESIAGEATLSSLLALFPLLAFVVPIAFARVLDVVVWRMAGKRPAAGQPLSPWDDLMGMRSRWSLVWLVAAFGPWLLAWTVTAIDIAPIFHRRFVIVSALPLAMLAAMELSRMRYLSLQWMAACSVALWLLLSQGTLETWRSGQWIGWQRVEDWRAASLWLEHEFQNGDEIWCASGLIEGRDVALPLDEELNRYLSYPLRGAYRIHDRRGDPLEPHALVGDARRWREQLFPLAGQAALPSRSIWIVYRGNSQALTRKLEQMLLETMTYEKRFAAAKPKSFGLVSVVQISQSSS